MHKVVTVNLCRCCKLLPPIVPKLILYTFIWAEITMVMMRHLQPITLYLNGMALRYDWSVSDEN